MNLDPAKKFRESPLANGWSDLVSTTQFQDAAIAALWMTSRKMEIPDDFNSAGANFFRYQGAQDFLANLMNLTEPEMPKSGKRTYNINHHA